MTDGGPMSNKPAFLTLASFNRIIVEGRERVDEQKRRVLALADQPVCRDAVMLLLALQRSVRLLTYNRAKHIKELIGNGMMARAGRC